MVKKNYIEKETVVKKSNIMESKMVIKVWIDAKVK